MTDTDLTPLRGTIEAYTALKAQIKALTDTADALALDIKAALGDSDTGLIDGQPAITYRSIKRTAFSQKLCKTLHPDVYAECQETTDVRALRIAGQ